MGAAAGVQEEQALREGGFTDSEVQEWRGQTVRELTNAGFSGQEIGEYFGQKEPDMGPVKQYFEENLKAPPAEGQAPREADDFVGGLEAGWKMSVTGLLTRQKVPDVVVPENAGMAARIAFNVGELAGDLPAMIAGFYEGAGAGGAIGGAAGSAVPALGTAAGAIGGAVVGGGAGAMALPAALRGLLMDQYEKGDFTTFSDFYERASGILWQTVKAGIVGGATTGVGGVAGKVLKPVASPVLKYTGQAASEVATMVAVGKGLEGEVPNAQDFIEAGILVGGLHASGKVAKKLRSVYAKTGLKPEQVSQMAMEDPTIKQDLASSNVEIPRQFENLVELQPSKQVPAVEPKLPELSEQQQKILSQVGEKAAPEGKSYGASEFYKDWVDRLDPIHEAVKVLKENPDTLAADAHPYQLARMANDFKAKTKHAIEKGTLDFKTLEQNGKSLKEITKPFKENLDGLNSYLISKRALEVEGRGLKSGFDVEAAKQVVKEGSGKYEAAAKELVDFQNRNLKYLRDSGVISEKSYDSLVEAGKAYIPFSRILDPEAGGGKSGKASSLKAFKGSDAKIQNPLISVLENTETFLKLAEKNRAVDAFIKLAETIPEQKLIEKQKTQMAPIEVSAAELSKALKEQGIEVDAEAFTIFRSRAKQLGPTEFEVFRDGKREVYKAEPELAEAFKALDGDATSMHFILRFMRGFTAAKKIGLTMTPDFILRNFIRDQLTAGVFTKGRVRAGDIVGALGDLIKKNETYYNWLKSGGANGTFFELDRNYLEKHVFELNTQTGFIDKSWNVVKRPIEWTRMMAELTEQSTRLAEFKRVSKGEKSGPDVFAGGYSSREVTIDFQRMGAKMSALNAITAFLNVSVQGLDRTARAVKQDPKGVTGKAAAYITLPSVVLWWLNKDDPRWREIPRWQKDMFWIVMTDDHIYRIPKPQELGIIFGSGPERALEAFFTDNPGALKDFDDTMTGMILPSMVPDAISPVVEQYFNKSLFTGHKIVPSSMEKILPEHQYSDYTSETAKMLGRIMAIPDRTSQAASPMVIENYIRAWSGNLGMYAVTLADKALTSSGVVPDPIKPLSTLSDIPAVKAFVVRYPSASAQSIQDFYERQEKNEQVLNTIHYLAKSGDFQHLQKELVLQANQDKLFTLSGIKEALANQNRFIRLIHKNPQLTPAEKREQIDGVYYQMIEQAKLGNQLFDAIEKSLKEGAAK